MVADGRVKMPKVAEPLFWQPFASVTVTVYVPAVEAVIDCEVAAVDQA